MIHLLLVSHTLEIVERVKKYITSVNCITLLYIILTAL